MHSNRFLLFAVLLLALASGLLATQEPEYSSTLRVAANWMEGNTRQARYGVDFKTTGVYADIPLFEIAAGGEFGKALGRSITQRALSHLSLGGARPEGLGWHLHQEFEHDSFKSLQIRSITTTGPCFHLFRTDEHSLRAAAGPAYTEDHFFAGGLDGEYASGYLSMRYEWKIDESDRLTASCSSNTSLENAHRTSVRSEISLTQRMPVGLYTTISVMHDHDGVPAAGRRRNDVRFTVSFGWNF